LDVLAVVALAVGQAEKALLEDGILAVPQSERKAEPLLVVGDAGQAVLSPAIGSGTCLIMAEVVPGVAALAVVFADRSPLPLAEVGSPFLPGDGAVTRFIKAFAFGGHGSDSFLPAKRCKRPRRHGFATTRMGSE